VQWRCWRIPELEAAAGWHKSGSRDGSGQRATQEGMERQIEKMDVRIVAIRDREVVGGGCDGTHAHAARDGRLPGEPAYGVRALPG
jgi:hypothetical protein